VKVEFDFETDGDVTPTHGVALLYCYPSDGEPLLLYGVYGEPSSIEAIGMYAVGLQAAKDEFFEGDDYP